MLCRVIFQRGNSTWPLATSAGVKVKSWLGRICRRIAHVTIMLSFFSAAEVSHLHRPRITLCIQTALVELPLLTIPASGRSNSRGLPLGA
jgi:hypothetical protein